MDRLRNILLFAALGCFALSFLLSGLYPWLITSGHVPEAGWDEVSRVVSEEFKDLKERWPVAFAATYPGSEAALTAEQLAGLPEDDPRRAASDAAWHAALKQALRDGRDSYVGEGCWHCHSQYVRPVSNESVRFGPVSTWQQDDNVLQRPVMWGTRRVGPDLTYEGGLHSNDWHAAHLWDPRGTSPDSVMPRYTWMFRDGFQLRRRIAPDAAERAGLPADTSYPIAGVYDTREQADQALTRLAAALPAPLAPEKERLFVAEGRGLNGTGLSLLAYLQWLGTWRRPDVEALP
ncbi:MAG TPA: cbb3-type cytochrome c oxidase subunit II [Planctomycetota bacterium]|nr:cbb3-type cytochrome c oxidase subunit II [Planctomycetota bacterium]